MSISNISIDKILNKKDFAIVEQFLKIKEQTGKHTRCVSESTLKDFFKFVNKSEILDIDEFYCEEYFFDINSRNLKYSSKKTKRSQINSFFEYFRRKVRRTNPTYYNPVPTLKECNFSADIFSLEEEEKKVKEAIFSIKQIENMLRKLYFTKQIYFVVSLLLFFCGMRISECVSIKIENVDLEKRFLITGIEEGARKSNKRGNKPLYFCFPPIVAYFLKEYILELKVQYPDNIWLFKGVNGHICSNSYQIYLKSKFNAKSHSFRKTLLTFALNLNNSTPLHFTELLTNHKISNVVMGFYNKISIEERVAIYDKFLPKEYSEIIKFCQKL